MDIGLDKRVDYIKEFHKTERNIKKNIEAMKNQNKMLFKMFKKSSSRRELKNIKNFKKASYDSSSSDNNSFSRDSDAAYSSIYCLSD